MKSNTTTVKNTFTRGDVFFNAEVLQEIRVHARSYMSEEICGVLIGKYDENSIRVIASIAGKGATQAGANVTFTQEAWENIYKVKDSEYPDYSIVGWYHSHPGFGIFLSEYDLFIHNNFFSARHQLAWVYDPHSDDEGCFGWSGDEIKSIKEIRVIQKDRIKTQSENKINKDIIVSDKTEYRNNIIKDLIEKNKSIIVVVLIIILFIDGYILFKMRNNIINITRNGGSYIHTSWNSIFNKNAKK